MANIEPTRRHTFSSNNPSRDNLQPTTTPSPPAEDNNTTPASSADGASATTRRSSQLRASRRGAAALKKIATAPPRVGDPDFVKWLEKLRDTQGGVTVRYHERSGKRVKHQLNDFCGGVSRHMLTKAIGMMGPGTSYRAVAQDYADEFGANEDLYADRSQRTAARREAGAIEDRHTSTHGMRKKHQKLVAMNYNAPTGELDRLRKKYGTGKHTDAVFDVLRGETGRHQAMKLLAAGIPMVASLNHHRRPDSVAYNSHYVLLVRNPSSGSVFVVDPWPGAKHPVLKISPGRPFRVPGTYAGYVTLGTLFGVFRQRGSTALIGTDLRQAAASANKADAAPPAVGATQLPQPNRRQP